MSEIEPYGLADTLLALMDHARFKQEALLADLERESRSWRFGWRDRGKALRWQLHKVSRAIESARWWLDYLDPHSES